MSDKTVILSAGAMNRVLTRIGHEIAERNENSHAVVVVGVQRGHTGLAGVLLGSVAQDVIAHVKVPVTLVK